MNTQTQPTDAEILDVADDFRSQYKHGGTTFDEFNALGFARAVLAKWGTPAGAVPLTPEAINAMAREYPAEDLCGWSYRMGVADAEAHYGIKQGEIK